MDAVKDLKYIFIKLGKKRAIFSLKLIELFQTFVDIDV